MGRNKLPTGKAKKTVNLGVPLDTIEQFGGEENLKKEIYGFIDSKIPNDDGTA